MIKDIIFFPEFGDSGGTRTYFFMLLKFYKEANFNVTVCLTDNQVNNQVKKIIYEYNFKLCIIPKRYYGYKNIFNRFPCKFLYELLIILYAVSKSKCDVIVSSIGTPGNMLTSLLMPKRVIYLLHTCPTSMLNRFDKLLVNFCLREDKKIVTVSAFAKIKICDFWLNSSKDKFIEYIYAFSNKKFSKEKNKNIIKDKENVVILTLGHVVEYKNPEIWFRVAESVVDFLKDKNISVEFIWAGEGELLEEYCKKSLLLSNNIKFIGFQEQVEDLYISSDIYFQPSKIESFGLSVLDAVKCGIPCIVSNTGGLPELVQNGENGYVVEVDDEDLIVKKIAELIVNKNLRKIMGKASKIIYEQKFSKDRWNKKMSQIHREII